MTTLRMKHLGGETCDIEVLFAYRHSLAMAWGNLAGIYYLDVRTNRLGRAPMWGAASPEEAKALWVKLSAKPDRHAPAKTKPVEEDTKGWSFSRGKTG